MLKWILTASLLGCYAFADSGKEDLNNVKRSAKKGLHHMEERVCAEGDAKCAAKKAKHRGEETKDYVKDKVDENTPSK